MEYLSKLFQKEKNQKKHEEIGFITKFKIEFLPPFTGCRKVLGKLPALPLPPVS